MKALGVSDAAPPGFVAKQIHYSLLSRDAENELVPVSIDQGLGTSSEPIAGGLLSGNFRRGEDVPETSRHLGERSVRATTTASGSTTSGSPPRSGRHTAPRSRRSPTPGCAASPGVTSLLIGACTEAQLADNLGAAASRCPMTRWRASTRSARRRRSTRTGTRRTRSPTGSRPPTPRCSAEDDLLRATSAPARHWSGGPAGGAPSMSHLVTPPSVPGG